MSQRRWKTEEEIDAMIESALDARFSAWEHRIGPTLDALRDGAQGALMINTLLAGDDHWKVKGFIPETRERLLALEKRSDIVRCFSWLMRKDEDGERRWHRIALTVGGVGSVLTYTATHAAGWTVTIRRVVAIVEAAQH